MTRLVRRFMIILKLILMNCTQSSQLLLTRPKYQYRTVGVSPLISRSWVRCPLGPWLSVMKYSAWHLTQTCDVWSCHQHLLPTWPTPNPEIRCVFYTRCWDTWVDWLWEVTHYLESAWKITIFLLCRMLSQDGFQNNYVITSTTVIH